MSDTATADTGQSSTSTGTAAPASSGPSSSPSPSSGPATVQSALTKAAAAQTAASPAGVQSPTGAGDGTPSGQTAATTQAPAAPTSGQPETKRGPIPFDVHETALKNAREKAEKATAERYAWANGLDPNDVKEALRIHKMLNGDVRGFYAQLGKELEEQGEDMPEPDYQSPDGKSKFFSADAMQKALTALENKLRRELLGKVDPLLTEHQQRQQAEQTRAQREAQAVQIREAITHMESLPFYSKENEALISEEMERIPRETVQRMGIVGAMYLAYSNFVAKHQQRLTEAGRQQVHEDLQRKAAAAGGQVAPTGNQPNVPVKTPRNESELAKHMERIAGGAV